MIAWVKEHRDPILIGLVVTLLAALILWLVGVLGDVFRGGSETKKGTVRQVDHTAEPLVRIDTSASRFRPDDGKNPALEYVCLVNKTGRSIDLQGWVLRDRTREVNTLPESSLPPHGHVRVHPGPRQGLNSPTDLYGEHRSATWNNDGDTVTLLDGDGKQVHSQTYVSRPKNDGTGTCGPPASSRQ